MKEILRKLIEAFEVVDTQNPPHPDSVEELYDIIAEAKNTIAADDQYTEHIIDFDELREQLANHHGVVDVFWMKSDIRDHANTLGVPLTDEQVDEVAKLLVRKHDANVGINWDLIEYWIREVYNARQPSVSGQEPV